MNYIDIIITLFIFIYSYKGFNRGFVKEIISFFAVLLGLYASIRFSHYVEEIMLENFDVQKTTPIISFIIVFITVFLTLKISAFIISKIVKALNINILNRILGLLFGGLKIIFISSFLIFEIEHIENNFGNLIPKKQKKESFLYPPLLKLLPQIKIINSDKTYYNSIKIKEKLKEIKNTINSTPE